MRRLVGSLSIGGLLAGDALCAPLPKPVPTASSSVGQAAEAGGVATPALRQWLRIQAGPMRAVG